MTCFVKNGIGFRPANENVLQVFPVLPPNNYVVRVDGRTQEFYLEEIDGFVPVEKVYGRLTDQANRMFNTFMDRSNKTTGILLSGEKGSGKSMLARLLALKGQALGMPTIIVNAPYCGDVFNQFVQSITQPAILLFDEFEKIYDGQHQDELLTLLDGVFPSQKMFILTCNRYHHINENLCNRPGRMFYSLQFTGLDCDFIRAYCADNLNNKDETDSICKISNVFDQFNFDMLKALVEEMNRYNESAIDSLEMLNIKPTKVNISYKITLTVNGRLIPEDLLDETVYVGSPLTAPKIMIDWSPEQDHDDDRYVPDNRCTFLPTDMSHIDHKSGTFHFTNAEGEHLVLTKIQVSYFNFTDMRDLF